MFFERYLELIAEIGYVGKPLKSLETELSERWGVSVRAVYYMIIKLRKEGLVRFRRYGRSKAIEVVPTAKLKKIMARIEEEWLIR